MNTKRQMMHALIRQYCAEHNDPVFDPEAPRVRMTESTMGADEISAALDTMLSANVTQGVQVAEFERQFSETHGCRHGVACNSGSSANLLLIAALQAIGRLPRCKEVIVPALSWSTTVWPLIQHGLVPVFVDCLDGTLNMDPDKIEGAISKRTVAIMPVHVYGNPCDMDRIMHIASSHGLMVIEDCCEATGATYKGRPVGSFGVGASFSFYMAHHMTTIEGGMAVTNDLNLANMMRIQRAHGWVRDVSNPQDYADKYPEFDPRFLFVQTGYNLRMTDVQAAIGLQQLPKLAGFIAVRRVGHNFYRAALGRYPVFQFQDETPGAHSSCFDFAVRLRDAPFTVKEICNYLKARNIDTRPIICGNLAEHPALFNCDYTSRGLLRNASDVRANGFALSLHHRLDRTAQNYVVGVIENFIREA